MKPKIGIWLLLVSGVALLAFGCGKKSESKNALPVQTAPAVVSPATPANSAAQSAVAPAAEVPAPDLGPLTQAVQIFIFRNKRRPNSVAELVSAGLVNFLPPLPPGKKLIISSTTPQVIMVNQ